MKDSLPPLQNGIGNKYSKLNLGLPTSSGLNPKWIASTDNSKVNLID